MNLTRTDIKGKLPPIPASDILLYAAYVYLISNQFLFNCTRYSDWGGQYGLFDIFAYVMEFVLLDYCIYGIIKEKDKKMKALLIIITVCGVLCDGDEVRTLCLMAAAMKDRPMKRIVKIWFVTIAALFAFTIFSSFVGLVEFHVNLGNQYEFGMIWHTDFGYTCLFLLMAYVVLKDGILKYYEYPIILALTFVMFYFTRAKNATICMLLFLMLILASSLYDRLLSKDGKRKEIRERADRIIEICGACVLDYAFFIGAIVFGIALLLRDKIQLAVDSGVRFLNTYAARLHYSWEALHFPVTPFGQYFYEGHDPYFMVDQFYSRLFVRHGAILFILVLILMTYALKRARMEQNKAIYISLLVLALFSQTDPQVIDCARDFIFPAILAVWTAG